MRTADFGYFLPPELIAQHPVTPRDASRLLVLHRANGSLEHRNFTDLPRYLRPGDLLVLNNSRVIPARLRATKPVSGGEVEVLLVEESATNDWWVMLRPGKRVRPGTRLVFRPPAAVAALPAPSTTAAETGQAPARQPTQSPCPTRPESTRQELEAVVEAKRAEGHYRLRFAGPDDVRKRLDEFGEVPLPPYIERRGPPPPEDRARYQTVFAKPPGSVAAPTAGLHFTPALIEQIIAMGVEVRFVTLHVGLGTFAPVKAERLEEHVMHEEAYELPAETAHAIAAAKAGGRRVVAAGTTAVRVLESAGPAPEACRGKTRLFLHPPADFRVVDAMLTNFHLPESTLLMLVCAFANPGSTAGRELALDAYAEAVRARYRFYSYGDAMLIL